MESNKAVQEDEVVALEAIYGDELKNPSPDKYEVLIRPALPFPSSTFPPLSLLFSFPPEYPTTGPPTFWLAAPWLQSEEEATIRKSLLELYEEQKSEIIFTWAEWLRENILQHITSDLSHYRDPEPSKNQKPKEKERPPAKEPERVKQEKKEKEEKEKEKEEVNDDSLDDVTYRCGLEILHSGFVTDRKSRFQSHLARVHSKDDVNMVLAELLSSKKIASATHNLWAFRIRRADTTLHEERDDDGETGAADKLLFLMSRMQLENVVVVVTRWYGGIQLGPDRFKHITNIAKELIDQSGIRYEEEGAKKPVSRPAVKSQSPQEVYNRIKYDPDMDPTDYVIGFKDGKVAQEVSWTKFEQLTQTDGKPPINQIVYLKREGVIVWDHNTPFNL